MTEPASLIGRPEAAPPPALPRLGFAGVGWIGRNRLDAIAASGCADIAAIADPAPADGERLWRSFPHCRRGERFEDLLDAGLDGVVIATPSALHADQAIAALECGLAVFCQKPLGRDARETAAVIDAARAANRLLGVDLSYRFTAGMQAIRREIRAGVIGKVHSIEAVFHNSYGPDKPWFYRRGESGGGCLLDLGIHLVDLALWCSGCQGGKVASARIRGGGDDPDGVERHATAHVMLDDGTSLQLATSWGTPLGCDAEIGIRFIGSDGCAWFRNLNGSFYDFRAEVTDRRHGHRMLAGPPDDWGGRAAVAWARQLRNRPAFDPRIGGLQPVAAILDSIYRNARGS